MTGKKGQRWGEARAYFWAHVDDITDDCIIWPYAIGNGYGYVRLDGRSQRVHILACERHYGPMPQPGMHAIHLPVVCHNPQCFNWRHLRWGTAADNHADQRLDGTMAHGDRNGHAKLTWEQVREIRARHAAGGISQKNLAAEYGVKASIINQIIHGSRWKTDPLNGSAPQQEGTTE